MSKFETKPTRVEMPADKVLAKFDDLSSLQSLIDQLPEAERAKVGDVKFERDTIAIHTSQVGDITFKVTDRTDAHVKFSAIGSPVPVELMVKVEAVEPQASVVTVSFDVNIPMMLRPMVAPHMQKAVDMLGDMIVKVASAQ